MNGVFRERVLLVLEDEVGIVGGAFGDGRPTADMSAHSGEKTRRRGVVRDVPRVSVVIPTFNRRQRLHRVLAGLAAQTFDGDVETVVVSDGSTDGTDAYLASGATPLPVVSATQENQGPAVARNHGVELATGDLVVFIDDDVVPDRGLISAHVAAHARLGDDVVVIGPMLDPPDHRMSMWIQWEQSMLAKQYTAMTRGDFEPTARQFYTGNASVLRRHVVDVGGFDSSFRRAEDVELAYRLAVSRCALRLRAGGDRLPLRRPQLRFVAVDRLHVRP